MARLMILFVSIVSLTIAGCVDGGEIAADALKEIDKYLESRFIPRLQDVDPNTDADGDGGISEDEINCGHPIFTTVEPFPPEGTTNVPELITPGNSYWECVDATGLTGAVRFLPNGKVEGGYTSGYEAELAFWNVCQVGPQPPAFSGVWVYYPQDEVVCTRNNIIPGVIWCEDIYSDIYYMIHQGENIAAFESTPSHCVYVE